MKRTLPAVLAAAALGAGLLIAPAANATPAPLSVSQSTQTAVPAGKVNATKAKKSPLVRQVTSYAADLFSQDFYASGSAIKADFSTGDSVQSGRSGDTFKAQQIDKAGAGIELYSSLDDACAREFTNYQYGADDDVQGTWTCEKGAAAKTMGTFLRQLTPAGYIDMAAAEFGPKARFAVTRPYWVSDQSIRIEVYKGNRKVAYAEFAASPKNADIPYAVTFYNAAGTANGFHSVRSLDKAINFDMVPFDQLTKQYN